MVFSWRAKFNLCAGIPGYVNDFSRSLMLASKVEKCTCVDCKGKPTLHQFPSNSAVHSERVAGKILVLLDPKVKLKIVCLTCLLQHQNFLWIFHIAKNVLCWCTCQSQPSYGIMTVHPWLSWTVSPWCSTQNIKQQADQHQFFHQKLL